MAKNKPVITNAMRLLTQSKVAFETIYYEHEGDIESDFGEKIAEITGINPECSYKTLVIRGDKNRIMTVCIPVNMELDLKKLATITKEKKVEMISVKELLGLTGYIRGGVSPIGMKKKYETFIDESCLLYDKIAVSGGLCGVTLLLSPRDLVNYLDAKTCEIAKNKN